MAATSGVPAIDGIARLSSETHLIERRGSAQARGFVKRDRASSTRRANELAISAAGQRGRAPRHDLEPSLSAGSSQRRRRGRRLQALANSSQILSKSCRKHFSERHATIVVCVSAVGPARSASARIEPALNRPAAVRCLRRGGCAADRSPQAAAASSYRLRGRTRGITLDVYDDVVEALYSVCWCLLTSASIDAIAFRTTDRRVSATRSAVVGGSAGGARQCVGGRRSTRSAVHAVQASSVPIAPPHDHAGSASKTPAWRRTSDLDELKRSADQQAG